MIRPFRFGLNAAIAGTAREWRDLARKAEGVGMSTFGVPDHFPGMFATTPALMAVADATDSLRITAMVYANDFRHPAMLAKEIATLDLLSGGRMEFGLGAGWMVEEYEATGIPFDRPGVRVERMIEGFRIVRGLLDSDQGFEYAGDHYRIDGLVGAPRPVQAHVPAMIGGGGRRLLAFAASHADIVGPMPRARPEGGIAAEQLTSPGLADKVEWIRRQAGTRFADLELHLLPQAIEVTDRRRAAIEQIAARLEIPVDAADTSPYLLVGSPQAIVEQMERVRETHGVSYYSFFGRFLDDAAPIVGRLAGT